MPVTRPAAHRIAIGRSRRENSGQALRRRKLGQPDASNEKLSPQPRFFVELLLRNAARRVERVLDRLLKCLELSFRFLEDSLRFLVESARVSAIASGQWDSSS